MLDDASSRKVGWTKMRQLCNKEKLPSSLYNYFDKIKLGISS